MARPPRPQSALPQPAPVPCAAPADGSARAPLDALVIGAGPAGLTAALYLARFRRSLLLADAGDSRARYIPVSHNTPGHPRGVSGEALLAELHEQAARYGALVAQCTVRALGRDDAGFVAEVGERRVHARTVLLATGVVDTLPAIPDMDAAIHAGIVRLCAVCDGYETAGLRVAVYGPPDAAVSHACFMRSLCADVTALVDAGCDVAPGARRRLAELGVALHAVEALAVADGGVHASFHTGDSARFDALYPVLGATRRSQLATDLGARTCDAGDLVVDAHQQTSVPGLFAIGDVVGGLNQISVAVGHAALAATAVHNALPLRPLPRGERG